MKKLNAQNDAVFAKKKSKKKKNPTSMSMMRPIRKENRDTAKRKSSLRFLRRNTAGYMSTTAVTRLSTHTNWWERERGIKYSETEAFM